MKVKEKKLADGRIQLVATATAEDVNKAFSIAERSFARSLGIQADGQTSAREAIQKQLRIRDADKVVVSQVLETLVPFALDRTNITPQVMPKGETSENIMRDRSLSFRVNVLPKPSYTLTSYEKVKVSVPKFEFDGSMLEQGIKGYVAQYPEFRAIDDARPVKGDDSCRISLEITENGEKVRNLCTKSRILSLGNDYMPASFEEHVIGMQPGETKSFEFDVDGYDSDGKKVVHHYGAEVEVFEIQEPCEPELTDEWVRQYMPMYGKAADVHRMFEQSLEQQQRKAYNEQVTAAVEAEWAKRFVGEIPDEAYQATAKSIDEMLRYQLNAQGQDYEQFVEEQGGKESYQMGLLLQARDTLRRDYALDAVFEHEHLSVSEDDANEAAKEFNPSNPEQARKELEEEGKNFALREIAVRVAASHWCVRNAEIMVED